MNTIVYVGMDVHKESYTLCCYCYDTDLVEYRQTIPADYRLVLKYMERIRDRYGGDIAVVCGYEAGCVGYSLYHQLTDHAVDCKILAPTTMAITNTNRVKTDRKDAANIARCLAFHTYSEVYVPDEQDNQVKEYIRMRDDQKLALKKVKQQILAFVLRQGKRFDGGKTYWTIRHMKWLYGLELAPLDKETLSEYLITYEYLVEKIERLDRRIEELASEERYREKVKKLGCFMGLQTHTALSMIGEISSTIPWKAVMISGRFFVVASTMSVISGMYGDIAVTTLAIASPMAVIMSGAASAIPSRREPIISPPLARICGRFSEMPDISCVTISPAPVISSGA